MAKVKHFENIKTATDFVGISELTVNDNHTRAAFTYETGAKIVISGEKLKINDDGAFTRGTVDKVVFKDMDGNVVLSVEDGKYNAKDFAPGDTALEAYNFYTSLLGRKDQIRGGDGDDYITGREGADRLFGGKGNDTLFGDYGADELIGGAGSDTFEIDLQGEGDDDVIRDFDIEGSEMDILLVDATIDKFTKANGGEDTLIKFVNGATLTLEGIEKADFLEYWQS